MSVSRCILLAAWAVWLWLVGEREELAIVLLLMWQSLGLDCSFSHGAKTKEGRAGELRVRLLLRVWRPNRQWAVV